MKKILLLLGLAIIFSCDKEEIKKNEENIQQNEENIQDCNCDRIVDIKVFNIVGSIESGTSSFFACYITTINDCNKMQKTRSFNYSKDYYTHDQLPKVGDCHDMGY